MGRCKSQVIVCEHPCYGCPFLRSNGYEQAEIILTINKKGKIKKTLIVY